MIYGFNAREVFKIALDIEENGRLFYQKAQEKTDDIDVKKIFAGLAIEEEGHKKRFTDLLNQLPAETAQSTVWDPDNELDQYLKMMADMHVFSSCDNVDACLLSVNDAKDALKMAMQFEKDSIIFFLELQTAAESAESREKIGVLVKEEQGHLKKLATEYKRLA